MRSLTIASAARGSPTGADRSLPYASPLESRYNTDMPLRVVIAEDEAIIRMDLRETLQEEGYDVVGETGRGDTVVDLIRETKPDLAILDIKMPGADGLEAARVINAERLCGVLMLTAFSQREVVEEARDAGALAFLVKPFQKSDLIPAIEVAMGRFRELTSLSGEVDALGDQLEARKVIDRAKGLLTDDAGLSESDAFNFIQKTAMSERTRMRDVADRILDGSLRPPIDCPQRFNATTTRSEPTWVPTSSSTGTRSPIGRSSRCPPTWPPRAVRSPTQSLASRQCSPTS